ncbi:hypothetical protein BGZ59_002994 [Podila verticillata]|nr:hypothetical protein BGZ59_002994 [Podila verticillata]KFH66734.1 hypothetical protein MVEG_07259 [Podila verticillata NRRL 6337]
MKSPLSIAVLLAVLATLISSSPSLKISDTLVTISPVPNPNAAAKLHSLTLMSNGYNENTVEDNSTHNNSTLISTSSSSKRSSSRNAFFEPLTGSHKAFIIPHEVGPARWSCKYNRDEVRSSPRGTSISIGRQSHLKPFSCGELISRETNLDYGVYSLDMISTSVHGHVTAFFLIANGITEIDIELTGLNSKVVWANVWEGHRQNPVKIPLGFDAAEGWHTYSFEWREDFIAWHVDDKQVFKRSDIKTADPKTTDYKLAINSWTQGVDDRTWAGRFKWSGRAIKSEFRNMRYRP